MSLKKPGEFKGRDVAIADLQDCVRIPRKRVARLLGAILGRKRFSVSVAFVENRQMRRVHRVFLGRRGTTDVMAFPLGAGRGEVVVSTEVARAEAKRRGISVEEELLRYVAHGLLHLLGYRDGRPAERRRMWARQERHVRNVIGRRSPAGAKGRAPHSPSPK